MSEKTLNAFFTMPSFLLKKPKNKEEKYMFIVCKEFQEVQQYA